MSYAGVLAWSAGLTLLLALGLWWVVESGQVRWVTGLVRLRNALGYGHFTLAYIFAWRLLRRQVSQQVAVVYLALFLGLVALYAVSQQWVPESLNALFNMGLFMTHHGANEVLFRQQTRNGYRVFAWTPRLILWVALAVGLVLLDRWGLPTTPWRDSLSVAAGLWGIGWLVYGFRYLAQDGWRPWGVAGWLAAGLFAAVCAVHPSEEAVFAVRHKFAWIVIYHYVVWYVFYTAKLLARTGGWRAPAQGLRSVSAAWKYATMVPVGFLGLVVLGNLAIVAICWVTGPVSDWMTATTQLDFFHINTFAHIMFGVGLPAAPRQAARQAGVPAPSQTTSEKIPQFA